MNKKLMRSFVFVALIALIVCGNFLTALAVETYTWEEKASMNIGRDCSATVAADGYIYVFGGRNGAHSSYMNTVEMYDPNSNTWEFKSNMITGRRDFSATLHNNKIYIIGGQVDGNSFTNSVEVYDITNDTWEVKSSIPTGRNQHKAVLINDKIYVVGGKKNYDINGYAKSIEVYDPVADVWDVSSELPYGVFIFGMANLNSEIYIVGGAVTNNNTYAYTSNVYSYNVNDNTWTQKASLSRPRRSLECIVLNDEIYAIGGDDGQNSVNEIEIFNLTENKWEVKTEIPNINIKTFGCTSIENNIYLAGGILNGVSYSNKLMMLTIPNNNSPTNLTATPGNAQVLLNWDLVTDADSYTVKRSTTVGGPYTIIAENITETSYLDATVVNGTTYYYVVTAINTAGESDLSNEASATPIAPIINRALLNITMQDSLRKEYDLSMTQVNSFIDWYNNSTGSELYTVENFANIGPFLSRKDYLVKGKIVCFEVMEYVN